MISVQSHHQLLNGNRFLFFLFLGIFIFPSCDIFKPARGGEVSDDIVLDPITGRKKKYNKKTRRYEYIDTKIEPVDTIAWRTPNSGFPPVSTVPGDIPTTDIGNGIDSISINLDVYKVGIVLPFLTSRSQNVISSKSKLALQFYAGVKMALSDLANQGVNLDVKVFDTNANTSTVNSLISNGSLDDVSMILGPLKKKNVKAMAKFAKEQHIPLVSPFSPTKNGIENPYLIQVNPSFGSHCNAIMNHILKEHDADQVVLVVRDKSSEKRRLHYFQDARNEIEGTSGQTPIKELIVSMESTEWSNIDLDGYLAPNKKTVFVIPSWGNEGFVGAMLRLLKIAQNKNDIVVYGMPQWLKFSKTSFDYFESLNVHLSSANFVDVEDPKIISFRQRYFQLYDDIPNKYAYQGYDGMMFFGKMLKKHGTQFQFQLDGEIDQNLHTEYNFIPVANPASISSETYEVDLFENKFVYILEFQDYHYQIAD